MCAVLDKICEVLGVQGCKPTPFRIKAIKKLPVTPGCMSLSVTVRQPGGSRVPWEIQLRGM